MTQPDLAATHERIVSMAVKLTGCTSAAILTAAPSAEVRITASTDPLLTGPLGRIAAETGQGPTMRHCSGHAPSPDDDPRDLHPAVIADGACSPSGYT